MDLVCLARFTKEKTIPAIHFNLPALTAIRPDSGAAVKGIEGRGLWISNF